LGPISKIYLEAVTSQVTGVRIYAHWTNAHRIYAHRTIAHWTNAHITK